MPPTTSQNTVKAAITRWEEFLLTELWQYYLDRIHVIIHEAHKQLKTYYLYTTIAKQLIFSQINIHSYNYKTVYCTIHKDNFIDRMQNWWIGIACQMVCQKITTEYTEWQPWHEDCPITDLLRQWLVCCWSRLRGLWGHVKLSTAASRRCRNAWCAPALPDLHWPGWSTTRHTTHSDQDCNMSQNCNTAKCTWNIPM